MPSPALSLRIPEHLSSGLDERASYYVGGRSEVVKTDLSRYRRLIRSTQARLKSEGVFSEAEQGLILDALNGYLLGDRPETLAGSVADSMSLDGTDAKWEVEPHAIRGKLTSLTPLEFAAVADGAERYWAAVSRGEERPLQLF